MLRQQVAKGDCKLNRNIPTKEYKDSECEETVLRSRPKEDGEKSKYVTNFLPSMSSFSFRFLTDYQQNKPILGHLLILI